MCRLFFFFDEDWIAMIIIMKSAMFIRRYVVGELNIIVIRAMRIAMACRAYILFLYFLYITLYSKYRIAIALRYAKMNSVMFPNTNAISLISRMSRDISIIFMNDLKKYAIAKNKNESLKYFIPL